MNQNGLTDEVGIAATGGMLYLEVSLDGGAPVRLPPFGLPDPGIGVTAPLTTGDFNGDGIDDVLALLPQVDIFTGSVTQIPLYFHGQSNIDLNNLPANLLALQDAEYAYLDSRDFNGDTCAKASTPGVPQSAQALVRGALGSHGDGGAVRYHVHQLRRWLI